MKDPDFDAPSHSVERLKETLNLFENSGSNYVLDPTPMEQDHEQYQIRQITCERIPRCWFEIEGEVFMIAPHGDKEPKIVNEALFGPKAKEWIKAMEEEIESMNANQV